VAEREPPEQEIFVAFENNGKFWHDTAGRRPFGGHPSQARGIFALNQ
jgi:hypothetical protein